MSCHQGGSITSSESIKSEVERSFRDFDRDTLERFYQSPSYDKGLRRDDSGPITPGSK